MDAVLLWIFREWHGVLIAGMYIFLFITLSFGIFKNHTCKYSIDVVIRPLAAYWVIALFYCAYIMDYAIVAAKIFAEHLPDHKGAALTLIAIYTIYMLLFFRSMYRLETWKPKSLRLTKLFLATSPIIIPGIALCIFYFYKFLLQIGNYDFDILYELESLSIFNISCFLSFPWLIYFIFSSNINLLWQNIDNNT